ncbi:MAG: apolipoprotein N-acyltransferase, partial [Actinomycetota bacterium]|nr:apolipoprotein N-acyltransferase [Actinomycetota bacterium]
LLLVTITVLAGQALAAFVDGQRRAAGALAVAVVAIVGLSSIAPDGHAAGSAEVAMVQGGGPQGTRKSNATVTATFARHVEATDGVRPPVDLILWPEDVIDTDEDFASDPWAGVISALAQAAGAPMIVGTVEGAGPTTFRNAAVLVDASGDIVDRYDKVHRVPFGEYVPLRSLLELFAEDALPDRDLVTSDGRARLDVPGPIGRASVAISWEVFFPDRAREGVGDGGRIIFNPTNGSSFSGTIVQTQQVASSRLRAIENGRWVLQVAPTGFSAVVDQHGEVRARSSISEATVIQGVAQLREGETFYTRVGNAPALVLSFLLIALGWAIDRRVSRR